LAAAKKKKFLKNYFLVINIFLNNKNFKKKLAAAGLPGISRYPGGPVQPCGQAIVVDQSLLWTSDWCGRATGADQ